MASSEKPRSASERVYEKLLSACPEEFRKEHGPQMRQAFGDLYREERHKGKLGLARLWTGALPDLATTAVLERSKATATRNPLPWRERIGAWDVIVAFILSFFLGIIAVGVFFSISPSFLDTSWDLMPLSADATLLLIINLAIILGIWLATGSSPDRRTLGPVGLRRTSTWWLFAGVTLGLVYWIVVGVAGALYFWTTGDAFYTRPAETFPGWSGATFLEFVFFWSAAGLLTALANELLFRGVLYTYLRRWGIGLAASVSAVSFGLFYLEFHGPLLVRIGAGVVLALVYEKSGSLWPAVACAATINTLGMLFGGLLVL